MLNIDEKFPSKLEALLNNMDPSLMNDPPTASTLEKQERSDNNGNIQVEKDRDRNSRNSVITDIFIKNLEFRRWLVLLSFFSLNFLNGYAWATYSPIMEEAKAYYSITSTQVLWFVYQFYILYIVFSFPGSFCLGKSLSVSLKAGSLLNAIGAWVRYAAFKNYPLALFGQCLIALSSNVIMAAPNNVANAWFHAKERFFAVTVGVFSNTFGTGVGYLVSPLIVGDDPEKVGDLNFISAVLLTVPLALCVAFVKEKPKYAPNISNTMMKADFWQSVKLLLRNKKYVITATSFGICFSNCWSILNIMDLFLEKEDVSSFLVGLLGLMLIVAGLISSFASTIFLRYAAESRKYFDPMIKILFGVTMIALILISIIIPMEKYLPAQIVGLMILGLGSLGLQPFECEALEEISFPVQESISVSGMFFISSAIGFPLSLLSTLDAFGNYGLWALTISMVPFTVYVLGIYKTDFKKSNKEGHFSSFNEKMPLAFVENEEEDRLEKVEDFTIAEIEEKKPF